MYISIFYIYILYLCTPICTEMDVIDYLFKRPHPAYISICYMIYIGYIYSLKYII